MINIDLSLKQEATLSPQMQQFFGILQANNQELSQLIAEQISLNPVLEDQLDKVENSTATDDDDFIADNEDWSNDDELINDSDSVDESSISDWGDIDGEAREYEITHQSTPSVADLSDLTRSHEFAYDSISVDKSLQDHLVEQVQQLTLEFELLESCLYLVGCLDDRGYFDEDEKSLEINMPHPAYFKKALTIIRDLEPVGVGAFDLQGCLLIQLAKQLTSANGVNRIKVADKPVIQIAYDIIKDEFKKLSKHQYSQLTKALNITDDLLTQSLNLIRSLNPAPGLAYQLDSPEILMPDITLAWSDDVADGGYKLALDQSFTPQLRINQQYKQLALNRQESAEATQFLKEQVQQARFWIYAINKRQETLLGITQIIAETQIAYLKGTGPLVPLSRQDIADALGIHQTTVSRSINAKSLQTPNHIYPLKSLLAKSFELNTGETVALGVILDEIKQLISKENSLSPLSDKKIAELLAQLGYDIPARTVSHYREKLGYLPAHLRITH